MPKLIPVGVSNRHMHLTREAMDILFGPGSELSVYKELYQKGEFASEQIVECIGPKGKFQHLRVLGPLRKTLQIEVSGSDAYHLGITPPIGKFTNLPDGQYVTLKGPAGSMKVTENVMISRRHIHINADDAKEMGVKQGDVVFVAPAQERGDKAESRFCIMGNVLVRVADNFLTQLHIDMDEGNAVGLKNGDNVFIVQSSMGYYEDEKAPDKKLITESDVRQAKLKGLKIRLQKGMIVTPAAKDLGKAYNIFVE